MSSHAPICCKSCGYILGHKWEQYWTSVRRGVSEREAMDQLGIQPWRYCCRSTMLTWVPNNGLSVPSLPPEGSKFEFRSAQLVSDGSAAMPVRKVICR